MTARNEPAQFKKPERISGRGLRAFLIVTGLLVIAFANAHLVYVAISSQPDCVDHLKSMIETTGVYRAAKSAC